MRAKSVPGVLLLSPEILETHQPGVRIAVGRNGTT